MKTFTKDDLPEDALGNALRAFLESEKEVALIIYEGERYIATRRSDQQSQSVDLFGCESIYFEQVSSTSCERNIRPIRPEDMEGIYVFAGEDQLHCHSR